MESFGMWRSIALVLAVTLSNPSQAQRIAFSFDDGFEIAKEPDARKLNSALAASLSRENVKAIFFATGRRVESEAGVEFAREWAKHGHELANHSYQHWNFHSSDVTLEAFIHDAEKNEALLSELPGWRKRYRFPYLKEGNTTEKRDGMRTWLTRRGYQSGAVTIDTSDWYYDKRLREWMDENPGESPTAFRAPYIEHLLARASAYSALANDVIGRDIDHVILLHTNRINAYFISEVVARFRAAGWQIIEPEAAYKDPIYLESPNVMPAGESLIWSLAKQAGKEGLRYPAEDGRYEKEKLDEIGL